MTDPAWLPASKTTAAYERALAIGTAYIAGAPDTADDAEADAMINAGRRLLAEAHEDGTCVQTAEFLAIQLAVSYALLAVLLGQPADQLWRDNCQADAADPDRPWENDDDAG